VDRELRQFQATHEKLPRPVTGCNQLRFCKCKSNSKNTRTLAARVLTANNWASNWMSASIGRIKSLDFHNEETNEAYYRRPSFCINVDVSDVEGAKLGQIHETISNAPQEAANTTFQRQSTRASNSNSQ
jgi:hypothetical protein